MVALDWTLLVDAVLNGIGDVIEAVITALTTHSTLIASLLVGGVIVGAVVKFGGKTFKSISSMFKKLIPK